MDPLLAARCLPALADRAVRDALVGALGSQRKATPAALADDALRRFERAVRSIAPGGVRPALLFALRDRMVQLVRIARSCQASARIFRLPRRDIAALGTSARPFDAIVRGRDGALHAVVWRRLPRDGRRLEQLRAARVWAARGHRSGALASLVLIDLDTGVARTLPLRKLARSRKAA